MVATLLDGKALSKQIRRQLKADVIALKDRGITPGLTVILVGEDPASAIYVRSKARACKRLKITSDVIRMAPDVSQRELLAEIERLNADVAVDGILVQLPLPKHIDSQLVLQSITPSKDVDGFHPNNVGRLMMGAPNFIPCTPFGMLEMLDSIGLQDLSGKRAVVIGRSNIVGKPIAMLLLHRHATVTICHSRTPNIETICRQADILVAAVGRPKMVKGDWLKNEAVVLDVGINRLPDGRLVGDVDFEQALEKAAHLTPVPGGVGPMTISMLLKNTVLSASRRASNSSSE